MKAILVVFNAAGDGRASSEPMLGIGPRERSQQLAVLNSDAGQLRHDQSPPPFWTWFIENPREDGRLAI
jgi:hypothetical protein